jgi:sulfite reductase (ferredoxin)
LLDEPRPGTPRRIGDARVERLIATTLNEVPHDATHWSTRSLAQKLKLSADVFKGPDTLWDAPGMMRIKIPFGGVTPDQLETLADLSEEYADGVTHVTTRQDFQFHYVHIDDTPALMRRLAAVGITSREACGNVVRNVTACPLAGICREETFDTTPYAKACARFLMGHPDTQDFGRKVKSRFPAASKIPAAW